MRLVAVLFVALVGCAPTLSPAVQRTLPEPLVAVELPPEPASPPPQEQWTAPVEGVEIAPGDIRDGVLFSDAMALRAAEVLVEYERIRGLYLIDIRMWSRERSIYERHLTLADDEIAAWRRRAERSWWEINGDEVGLVLGLVIGAGLTLGIGAIVAELGP